MIIAHAEILWIDDWWPFIPMAAPLIAMRVKQLVNRKKKMTKKQIEAAELKLQEKLKVTAPSDEMQGGQDTQTERDAIIDVDELTARQFPYGAIGDVRFDIGQHELVMIEECRVVEHVHDPDPHQRHEHRYIPSVIGAARHRKLMQYHQGREQGIKIMPMYETRACNHPDQLIPVVASDLAVDLFKAACEAVKAAR